MSGQQGYCIGIDLGGTTFAIGVFDAQGALVDKAGADTPVTCIPGEITAAMTGLVGELLARRGYRP